MRRLAFALVLGSAAGCGTYAINRAAFVPHATPVATNGQSLTAPVEMSLGASSATDLRAPASGDPNSGAEVPNTQLRGAFALRINPIASIAFGCESAPSSSANKIRPSQPSIDGGSVTGCGPSLSLSIPTSDPHWRIGLSTELTVWSIPWIAYSTCIDGDSGCVEGYTTVDSGNDDVATIALGLIPSYRNGRWTVYGGLTVRNHPTVTEKSVQTGTATDGDVQAGPANLIASAGAELDLDSVRLALLLQQDLTRDPVAYGPSLGAMLTVPLGRDDGGPR